MINSNISLEILDNFFDYAYPLELDIKFKEINKKLSHYYLFLLDGLVLAAKMAVFYHNKKDQLDNFSLSNLYRVERLHYYDHCYHMSYIPEKYADYLTDCIKK